MRKATSKARLRVVFPPGGDVGVSLLLLWLVVWFCCGDCCGDVEILSSACWGGVGRRWPGFACDGMLSMSRFIFTSIHFSTFTWLCWGLWVLWFYTVPCDSKFQFRLLAARNLFLFKYPLPQPPRPVGILVFSYCPIQLGKSNSPHSRHLAHLSWFCSESVQIQVLQRAPPLCSCSCSFTPACPLFLQRSSLSFFGPLSVSPAFHLLCQLANIFCGFIVRVLARTTPGWLAFTDRLACSKTLLCCMWCIGTMGNVVVKVVWYYLKNLID